MKKQIENGLKGVRYCEFKNNGYLCNQKERL